MPLYKVLKYKNETSVTNDVTEVYIWHITESEEELKSQVSVEVLAELQDKNFKNARRRIEWLATRVLLRSVSVGARIQYYPSGKPYLQNSSGEKYLSISHTGVWVAMTISSHPIGVDIECWSDRPYRLSHKFLSNEEISSLKTAEDPVHLAMQLWTAKEAAFKCFNQSATHVITHISIHKSEKTEKLIAEGVGGKDVSFVFQEDFEEFSMSLCTLFPL